MLPQPTVYAKILYLLMMLIAGALCNTDQVYLYSKCSGRFVGTTPDGKVHANDNSGSGRQTITISNPPDFFEGPLKLALFIEEAQMYVCFTKRWRIVTSKTLHASCYFYETLENGWFQFRSAVDQTKKLGFNKKGKPITNRQSNHQCINFQKKKVTQGEQRMFKSRPAAPPQQPASDPPPPSTTVPTHLRHKHDLLKRQHKQQELAEQRQIYAQSHIPQPHSHHLITNNVTMDAAATSIDRPRSIRPFGGVRRRPNKHRAHAGTLGTTTTTTGKGNAATPKQRSHSENRHPDVMANDEPLRAEDLPNMLDYPPNEEYTKFRARPSYYTKPETSIIEQPDANPKVHQHQPHSLVPPQHKKLVVQAPLPPHQAAAVRSSAPTTNHNNTQNHTKVQLPKFRNTKRLHLGKKSYGTNVASSSNRNSNS